MPKKLTKETAKEIIENKLKKETPYILFIGFEDNVWLGNRKTKIILKCTKHNIISSILYKSFIADGWKCNECYHENHRLTKEEAEDRIEQVHKNNPFGYKYIIPKDFDIVKGNSDIIIICPIHGKVSIKYRTLINHGNCPKCLHESRIYSIDKSIKIIKSLVNQKNKLENTNISFIGFINEDKWDGIENSKIKLRCNIHNITYIINYKTFSRDKCTGGCPKCSKILYKSEDFCFDIISSCVRSENIQRNFYIYFNNNKFIKVDFFIKKLNCIIEFDGIQHYEFVPFLQKTYSKFINQVNRDRCLEQYCKENNICLLRIPYKDNNRIPEIIKIFFEEGKDITTKVEPKLLPVLYYG